MDLFVVELGVEPRESANIPAEARNVRLKVWLYEKSQLHARNSAEAHASKHGFFLLESLRTTQKDPSCLDRLQENGDMWSVALVSRIRDGFSPVVVCEWEFGAKSQRARDMLPHLPTQ